jgi:hypothetical protein
LHRLDQQSGVGLVAPEKQGQDALEDEAANRKAICIVDVDEEDKDFTGKLPTN